MLFTELLFSFQGRIGRQSYWFSVIGLNIAAYIFSGFIGTRAIREQTVIVEIILFLVFSVSLVLLFWVSLAVNCKRWHDHNKSGWWTLIFFAPIVGQIWVLIELGFLKGTPGPNRFGEDPLT